MYMSPNFVDLKKNVLLNEEDMILVTIRWVGCQENQLNFKISSLFIYYFKH